MSYNSPLFMWPFFTCHVGKYNPVPWILYKYNMLRFKPSSKKREFTRKNPKGSMVTGIFKPTFCTVNSNIHPGRLTWNIKFTLLKRKIIFQTIIFRFYVNLRGCIHFLGTFSSPMGAYGENAWGISYHVAQPQARLQSQTPCSYRRITLPETNITLGGGFKYVFIFTPTWGNEI